MAGDVRVLALAAAALMLLAGCSSPSEPSGQEPPKDAQGRYVIELTSDNKVVPSDARVPAGSRVVWKVGAGGFHDVTSDAGAPEAFTSDSQYPQKMRGGDEFEFTFTKKGTYPYRCVVHGTMMVAKLTVV